MGAFLRPRSPRGGKNYALRSRRVQWLGPSSPSAGGAVLSALGSHESDGGVQYHATRRIQAAGTDPSGQDGGLRQRWPRR